MPAKKAGLNSSKPVSYPREVCNMCSAVEELRKEIDQLEEANEILRKEIKQFEDDSLSDIQSYRTTIDGQTSTVNKIKHKIEDVINEMNNKMQQLRDENEAKKDGISQEKAEVEKEIEQLTEQLEIVRQFEIDKDSIASEIRAKELAIEEKKITPAERRTIVNAYENGLRGYTYFER